MSAQRKIACVKIGGIPIALSTSDDAFLNLLKNRYQGFLSSSPPEFELDFDLMSTGPVSDDDVRVFRDGEDWLIKRGDFHARWDPARDEALCGKTPVHILSIRCCALCIA